jgi:O-antigen ligase
MTVHPSRESGLAAAGNHRHPLRAGLFVVVAVVGGAVLAYLLVRGQIVIALALLLAFPTFLLLQRYPVAVIGIWLLAAQFLTANEEGSSGRSVYWLVHRALPVAAVLAVMVTQLVRLRSRPLPRLGWPELAMVSYLAYSALSIAFTSPDVPATLYLLFDRVLIPMCLYLLVRLLEPGERQLRVLLPILGFVLISQSVIGGLAWINPGVLPEGWLGREGTRTVGSLQHPNVYGTVVLACGALLFHAATSIPGWRMPKRLLVGAGLVLALVMVFLTYSRASWLAAVVVVLGLAFLYPRVITKAGLAIGLAAILLVGFGLVFGQTDTAAQRLASEETALSRLPVVVGSIRMFQQKPVTGWGYGNFDLYDYQFQGQFGELVVPEKDHASHNLFLTILAEQGLIGLLLYLAPLVWWLVATRAALRTMPATGFISRKLLIVLWLVLAAIFVVSNLSNMRVVFGLGVWWMTLGLIGSLIERYRKEDSRAPTARVLEVQGSHW